MGWIGGELAVRTLRRIAPRGGTLLTGDAYRDASKLAVLFGPAIYDEIRDQTVLDFGCGFGNEAVEMARRGARRVIGIDIREHALAAAREQAAAAGVADRCFFGRSTEEKCDLVLSLDSFEHYSEPLEILRLIRPLLNPSGRVLVSFGPPWYHPYGGHLFSVFPWAHLVFTERAFMRWRSEFKSDGATRFGEVDGGLNQMTVHRFRQVVAEAGFEFQSFEAVPIRKLAFMANPLTREFTTSTVRCRLRLRAAS